MDNADPFLPKPVEPSAADLATQAEAPTKLARTMLFGRYRVLRELGVGGMGRVVLAEDTVLGVEVAVKILPDAVASDADAVRELRKEVVRGRALTHPGIVRTHTFEQDESGAGIVMEYVEGATLSQVKARQLNGCFDGEDILPWLEQLCAILDYAHRDAQIVHRDLKPNNLLLARAGPGFPKGRIKVADFGLAATLSESVTLHSREGITSGTPPYMSPQQASGARPTALDDIYSLGATIYDLLTGKPPFFRGDILAQIREVAPPTMASRRVELGVCGQPPLPPAWEEAIAACLAKNPARRPQSAQELLDRLRGKSTASEEIETKEEVSVLRWKWAAGAAAVAVVALTTFLVTKSGSHSDRDRHVNEGSGDRSRNEKRNAANEDAKLLGELTKATATEPFENNMGMKFVPVPITGGPTDSTVSGLKVLFAATETTEAIYKRFVAATGTTWPAAEFVQRNDHPVVNVSWNDAVAFCKWLTDIERASSRLPEGARYRLPSDHEWSCAVGIGAKEDAAKSPKEKRGAIPGVYPWGAKWPPPERAGNYADAAAKKAGAVTVSIADYDDGLERTSPVEAFSPNALGLYGLGDNVSEWCDDWYDPAKKDDRTLRGASWMDADELYLLSSFRGALDPTQHFTAYGFRCVLELKDAAP